MDVEKNCRVVCGFYLKMFVQKCSFNKHINFRFYPILRIICNTILYKTCTTCTEYVSGRNNISLKIEPNNNMN